MLMLMLAYRRNRWVDELTSNVQLRSLQETKRNVSSRSVGIFCNQVIRLVMLCFTPLPGVSFKYSQWISAVVCRRLNTYEPSHGFVGLVVNPLSSQTQLQSRGYCDILTLPYMHNTNLELFQNTKQRRIFLCPNTHIVVLRSWFMHIYTWDLKAKWTTEPVSSGDMMGPCFS